jgi:hypothetical protein
MWLCIRVQSWLVLWFWDQRDGFSHHVGVRLQYAAERFAQPLTCPAPQKLK